DRAQGRARRARSRARRPAGAAPRRRLSEPAPSLQGMGDAPRSPVKTTLTPGQLAHFRSLLIERIARLYQDVHSDVRQDVQGGRINQPDPGDVADESMGAQLGDLKLRLDEREAKLAQAMEGALERIRRGEYGMCEE